MKVIEYFNFKNKPLTKDERQNIEKQVNEFIELYNNHNLNKDPNNPLLNSDELHSRLNLRRYCYEIVTRGIGKVLYTTINNTFVYTVILDVGQCFNQEHNKQAIFRTLKAINKKADINKKRTKRQEKKHLEKMRHKYEKEIGYITKEIYNVCPTTCLFFTNLNFNNWFTDGSPIKAVLSAYPCYNMLGLTDEEISQEQIDESNETRTYSFSSVYKADMDVWYFNKVFKMYQSNLNNEYHYYIDIA